MNETPSPIPRKTAASATAPIRLSVCIITGNEEENIRRCLASVSFADEIVIVDSFSTDRTLEIAREFTDRVFQHRWTGYIGQKAIARNLARGEWILFVDADEAVSPGLRDEILDLSRKGIPDSVAGFDFPRMVWFLHRWIRHGDWYPDAKLRLFRKAAGRCCGTEPHERIDVDGEVLHLRSPLYHYTYDDIEDQLRTMNRFSSISAGNAKLQHYSLLKILACMLLHPPFRFLRCYLLKRGFLDGVAGLVIASTVAYGTFIKYAKVWEKRIETRRRERVRNQAAGAVATALALSLAAAASGVPAVAEPAELPALALLDAPTAPGAGLPDDAPWLSDPEAMLAACAARMPRERVRLDGRINMRKRYGVSLRAYSFVVDADFSASPVVLDFLLSGDDGTPVEQIRAVRDADGALSLSRLSGSGPAPLPSDSIAGTDVSWFDACMDFLWWRNPRFAGADRVKGRDCILLDVDAPSPTAACAKARLWVDPTQLVVLQAAQYDAAGRETRRVWVRAVQRREGRWVFKDLEVESRGGVHRTRLHFEGVEFPDAPIAEEG